MIRWWGQTSDKTRPCSSIQFLLLQFKLYSGVVSLLPLALFSSLLVILVSYGEGKCNFRLVWHHNHFLSPLHVVIHLLWVRCQLSYPAAATVPSCLPGLRLTQQQRFVSLPNKRREGEMTAAAHEEGKICRRISGIETTKFDFNFVAS